MLLSNTSVVEKLTAVALIAEAGESEARSSQAWPDLGNKILVKLLISKGGLTSNSSRYVR